MNTEKGHIDCNTNINNSFHEEHGIKATKKKRSSKPTTTRKLNLANKAKISTDILDMEDSPDIATWNKDVIRNKDLLTNKENRFKYSKIKTPIPTITTTVFKKGKGDNKGIEYLIDPANLNEIAKVYQKEEILTDQANFPLKKGKSKKKIKF
jgi:hypothetical protein